jgi:threonyl-tRNA synthetase
MKLLFWHTDYIKVRPTKEALKEKDEKLEIEELNEPLVVLVSIEKGDEKFVDFVVEEIEEVFRQVGAKSIVIYPYAHLSSNLESPSKAREILNKIVEKLKEKNYLVKKAPFGWYKEFEVKVKGHPLSELSRTIDEEYVVKKQAKKAKEEKKEEGRFIVIDEKGNELSIEEALKVVPEEMKTLIEKEALKKDTSKKIPIDYHEIFKKFGFEWEPLSDSGHMRMNPKAALMYDLAAEYIRRQVHKRGREKGINVFEVKGTNMFDLNHPAIKTHALLYGDRLYTIETEKREFVLRYAACFQQFAMAKDWQISYKHLPFGMLEVADSYRLEQRGEVELLFRLRKFTMPDWHTFCKDEEEAKEYMLRIHDIIMDEMENKIGKRYWLLINVTDEETYERYKDYLKEIAKSINRPVLIYIYPKEEKRYWTINIEYHIIDNKNKPREIGTVQIDIGNWQRFGITYTDKDNKEKGVIILHTAILGTVERFLYTLFDKAIENQLKGKKPYLPVWIAPIQVRIIPVNEKHIDFAKEVLNELLKEGIRADLDDRDLRFSKKIAEAEKEWVNYIVVIGDKEIESKKLSVKVRELNDENKEYSVEELIKEIKEKTKDYPKKELTMPELLSLRPKF